MATAHVVYAFSRREGARSNGGYHLRLDEPLNAGRLRRSQGDALCDPRRDWWGLERRPNAEATCPRCLGLAARYGVVVNAATDQQPAG